MKAKRWILLVCLFNSYFYYAHAQTQTLLDTTFGDYGHVYTSSYPFSDDEANDICVQDDNKIVVVGYTADSKQRFFFLTRHNENGDLDTDFGYQGKVRTSFSTFSSDAITVKLQTDGKIVVAGYVVVDGLYLGAGLVRYHTDGSIDESFGDMGKVITTLPAGQNFWCYSMLLQEDGKIVVAGKGDLEGSDDDNFVLIRYHSNGQLDDSFGEQGISITDVVSNNHYGNRITDLSLHTDGKIIAVGNSGSRLVVARFLTNGTFDSSFGTDGAVLSTYEGSLTSVKVLPDNSIVAAGFMFDTIGARKSVFMKLTAEGEFDPSFGDNGVYVIPFVHDIYDILVQADGKIIAGAYTSYLEVARSILIRIHPDGSLDTSYGHHGIGMVYKDEDYTSLRKIAMQYNDKVVICGRRSSYPSDMALSRCGPELITHLDAAKIMHTNASVYPNPSTKEVQLSYELLQAANVHVQLINNKGQVIRTITEATMKTKGAHQLGIQIEDLSKGHYYLLMHIDQQVHSFPFVKQ